MNFIGTVVSWIVASAVAHVLSASASQWMALSETAALLEASGASLPLMDRLRGTVEGVLGLWPLGVVIAIGLLIAFFVASLVKAVIPPLAPMAYIAAGAAAMATILVMIPIAIVMTMTDASAVDANRYGLGRLAFAEVVDPKVLDQGGIKDGHFEVQK